VAFYSYRSGNRDIWVMPAAGGPARQVTRDEEDDYMPAWSPDGQLLAFRSRRSGNHDIWVIPAEGGEARRLSDHPPPGYAHYPSWSPNGEWLAFSLARFGGGLPLWRIPSTGGEAEQLSDGPGEIPLWSPDGKRIYFLRAQNLWELSIETGIERRLTDLQGKGGQRLTGNDSATDGQHLYFTWGEPDGVGDICAMDVVRE